MKFLVINFLLVVSLNGCATVHNPDPLESINRKTFAFNESVDESILRPVAQTYQNVIPQEVRASVSNFYANPRDLLSALSLFLQGRSEEGFSDVLRFGANTFYGLFGLFDIATEMGFKKHNEDIGQALGNWGVGPGPYIVWPLLGPATVRDTTTLISNILVTPQALVSDDRVFYAMTGLQVVNTRSELLSASEVLDDAALDKYLFVRDAYLTQRKSLVYDGNPPALDEDFHN